MSEQHLEPESISAHLDGELTERERVAVDRHLASCEHCSTLYSSLAAVSGRLAALPAPRMNADEHRELRRAVINARPARATWWGSSLRWALAGGFVLVAVAAAGFGFLRSGGPADRESPARTEAAAPADSGPDFNFTSGEQVDRVVGSLPEVAAGLGRYRPEDAVRAGDGGESSLRFDDHAAPGAASAESAPAQSAENDAADQAAGAAPEPRTLARTDEAGSETAFSNQAADACLARVAASQTTPMVPLLARRSTFLGTPAWLLVFAWSPDPAPAQPLDRWQTWVVTPEDCRLYGGDELASRALHRSFSGAD